MAASLFCNGKPTVATVSLLVSRHVKFTTDTSLKTLVYYVVVSGND